MSSHRVKRLLKELWPVYIAIAIAIGAWIVLMASPAEALHHDTRCETQSDGQGDIIGRICVTVNTHDVSYSSTEALAWVNATCRGCEVQFNYVHLYRENNEGRLVLVRQTGSQSGWMSEGGSYSTNWYERDPEDGCRDFYAVTGWRSRTAGGNVLSWEKTHSVFYTRLCW